MLSFFGEHKLLLQAVAVIIILLLVLLLTRINHRIYKRLQDRHKSLHLHFFERVSSVFIIIIGFILAFSVFGGIGSVWKSLLGGTAILSAVLAFAAQDAIKDILAGLMISLYKPFEVGNRIVLEDGTAGIVKDITMRHVVLILMDTQCLVIPNSKLNQMSIKNFSYKMDIRSALFNFHIAYDSDVKDAMKIIRGAISESEYSVFKPGTGDYGDVYFMEFENSSLRLATTVYYNEKSPSEVVISDINSRVNTALVNNGIEIPYEYINIIQNQDRTDKP